MDHHKPLKLRVAIIGGGIAGLAAAGFLRKYPQYIVTVYELRGEDWQESSAALGLQTNGTSIVEQLGITRKEVRGDTGIGHRTYNIHEELMSTGRVSFRPDGETGFWFVHRQDLKDSLLRRVTSVDGDGEPIHVVYDSHIVEINPELGILKFADGPSIEADLIIDVQQSSVRRSNTPSSTGADGIHSKVREFVIPASHPEPALCGLCVYRFVVPMDVLRDGDGKLPDVLTLDEGSFVVIIAAGDKGNRNIVIYPCRELELMNFVCGVPDTSPRVLAQLKSTGSHESLLQASRTTLIEPFPILDQEPLPTYVKGRTVLVGDAAHAMAPYQAQATNQAFEDVEGLNVVLVDAFTRHSIPGLLETWDNIRRPHASIVQRDSRDSQAKLSTTESSDAFLGFKPYMPMNEILGRLSV
ncbi:hypothetical protein N7466_008042 [Penicillium verhagenii]|uniref:uncharacterized protein n=1 Tax=Penicillium verhagenii TaxID=1562060 RepID=UPI002544E734|nr:uncharacterized protein N7466_008042 [Penicillium verhagenii]KAJ5923855.1 hypothetical protein N7466_008042 [Penicillium verhagenii]